jgi:hypothetical protein
MRGGESETRQSRAQIRETRTTRIIEEREKNNSDAGTTVFFYVHVFVSVLKRFVEKMSSPSFTFCSTFSSKKSFSSFYSDPFEGQFVRKPREGKKHLYLSFFLSTEGADKKSHRL